MASKVYGIDFGTSTIKIYKKNEGIVYDERNMVAVSDRSKVIAIGDEAYEMYEKAPSNILVTYPVRSGVIADIANMVALLNQVVKKIHGKSAHGAEFIIAVPTDITEVEKRSFLDVVSSSSTKAKKIRLVEKPIADALGAGLDVTHARGVMVVNIGADTTEVSILSLGGIVLSKLIPVGGNKLDEAIRNAVKKQYNLIIGDKTAEYIKKELATAIVCDLPEIKVYGRDVVTGLPVEKEVKSDMVYQAISEYLYTIIDSVKIILERTPPEIASDIIDSGIYITGGSAYIKNLDVLMHNETDLKINISLDAANTVVNGLGKIIEEPDFNQLATNPKQLFLA